MEPQEQDVLQRYYQRLSENIEPKDLLNRLGTLGAIHSEDFETVLKEWVLEGKAVRHERAEWLLESLRNHDQGLEYLVKGLLLSESQDNLAREILEHEFFEQNDIQVLLESLRGQLNEVQILKLELLKERKKHEDTKRILDEVKSNRTSAIFSDYESSCCSGCDSSDVTFLLKELDEEKKRREAAERRTDELVESHQQILRHFKSLEDVRLSKPMKDSLPWKAASVADLCVPERDPFCFQRGHMTKWASIDSGAQMKESGPSNRNSFTEDDQTTGVLVLAEKVSTLEARLEKEINKRAEAECEISKLENENRSLHEELFETRDELYETRDELFETRDQLLASSQIDVRVDNEETNAWNEDEKYYVEQSTTTCNDNASLHDDFTVGRRASCPSLNQENCLSHQNVGLRHHIKRVSRPVSYHGDTRLSYMWQNRNTVHYEMDQYDNEIKSEPNPKDKDFRFALRRLKLDTWKLYNDVLMSGLMITSTRNRAKRLSNFH